MNEKPKFLSLERLQELVTWIKTKLSGKVDKEAGKSLVDDAEIVKLGTIEENAQANVIEGVSVNGVAQTVDKNKIAKISLPIKRGNTSNSAAIGNIDLNVASSQYAIAEGAQTTASGEASHAEGERTTSSGSYSHAEGLQTVSSGSGSHAEGTKTQATNFNAHAEGNESVASGQASHAEGSRTTASGNFSHSQGRGTIAAGRSQDVSGEYNIEDASINGANYRATYAEIVGNGTSDSDRSNARTLDWDGNEVLAGKLTVGAAPSGDMDVATKGYVDTGLADKQDSLDFGTPTAEDVGKALMPKTIENGEVTEWEFGEAGMVDDVQINGTSIVVDKVANVPIASSSKIGAIKYNTTYGTIVNPNTGDLAIYPASQANIKEGTQAYRPPAVSNQHYAVFYGLTKAAGVDMASSSNPIGTYTPEAKAAIKTMIGVEDPIDVQVDGTSIVNNGVANIPAASSSYGVVKVLQSYGITTNNGFLTPVQATDSMVQNPSGSSSLAQFRPITPALEDKATFYGLALAAGDSTQSASANAVGTYTDEAKTAIKSMLGVADGAIDIGTVETLPSGSDATASITGDYNDMLLNLGIPIGATGNGIASIEKTGTSGLVDTYTITYTDGTTTTFTVTNGADGAVTNIDDTLTQQGKPADAKKVGDELTDIKEDLNDVEYKVGGTYSITKLGTWKQGGLRQNEFVPEWYYRLSTISPVYIEDALTFNVETGRRARVYTVTSDGAFVSDSEWIAGGNSYTIPADTYVMMTLSATPETDASEFEYHATIDEFKNFATFEINPIFVTENELNNLIDGFPIVWNTNKALSTAGTLVEVENYSASDLIKITDIVKETTFINLRQRISWTIVPICFYSISKSFIGYYTDTNAANNSTITVKISDIIDNYPNAEYIRIGKANGDNVSVVSPTIKSLDTRVTALEQIYPPYNITAYPKILCCGDSVTYGYVVEGTQENPAQVYRGMPEQSYPSCINRIYNNDITTVAQSGISIKQFYEQKYPTITFNDYDIAIFELGLNPGNEGYLNISGIDTEGTSAYIYRQMIASVRASAPNLTIVLMRSPSHSNNWPPVLEYIANESNCLIIDLADTKFINLNDTKYHGWYDNNGTPAFDDTHYTRIGYSAKAYDVICWLGEILPN